MWVVAPAFAFAQPARGVFDTPRQWSILPRLVGYSYTFSLIFDNLFKSFKCLKHTGSDLTNSNNVVLDFSTCGLSLPSREYYTEEKFKEKRDMYVLRSFPFCHSCPFCPFCPFCPPNPAPLSFPLFLKALVSIFDICSNHNQSGAITAITITTTTTTAPPQVRAALKERCRAHQRQRCSVQP